MNRDSIRAIAMSLLLATGLAPGTGCTSTSGRQHPSLPRTTAFTAVATTPAPDPALLVEPTDPFRLGVGDMIEIEVLETGNTRRVCRVMPDGLIYYDLLPGLPVAGLTLPELKIRLQDALADYYRSPQVALILRAVNSKRVWVLGRVNTSGLYALNQPTTLLEALARAGGLFSSRFSGTTEELADLKHSFVVRNGELLPVDFYALLRQGDMAQNIYLHDGDYIYLPSALSKQVFVLGAVAKPRAVGFMDQVTVVSAIASAFDVLPRAYTRRILIIRGRFTAPEVAVIDYEGIRRGELPDVPLEPGDIVWVPDSPWTNLTDYTKLVLNTFVRTVAANEGARFAVPGAGTVDVNIDIGGGK